METNQGDHDVDCAIKSQQAMLDALADNITSLRCAAASVRAALPARSRTFNRSCATDPTQRLSARPALFIRDMFERIGEAIATLGTHSQRFVPGRSQPHPVHHAKPHLSAAYKG